MFRRSTPVLYVDKIEPMLPFWVESLGFTQGPTVPHGDEIGFVILQKDGVEIMYQTHESLADDLPGLAVSREKRPSISLYVEVSDLSVVERSLAGRAPLVPRRQTAYGATEAGWAEPGGHLVLFAQHG